MAAVKLDVQEKSYPAVGDAPAKLVLDQIRLSAEAGERLAIIGPSGCGKTTLLNIVAGLERRYSGRLEVAAGTRLAYVFQEPRLLPWRTVEQNLRLVLPATPDPAARIAGVLAEVGLEAASGVYASRLSLGMARRAALARAFVVEPGLLLLDEPFVSLDEPTAYRLRLLLLALLERHRSTTLFVTHSLQEAIMIADRLIFLSASPARVLSQHAVPLAPAERRRPATVEALRTHLLETEQELAELLLPPSESALVGELAP